MPFILNNRAPDLVEEMDRDDCDLLKLENTYKQFSTINRLLSGWRKIYQTEIRPHLNINYPHTLLDIGFGGGDLLKKLSDWSEKDGLLLECIGVETDSRALHFAQNKLSDTNIELIHGSSGDLVKENKSFDFIVSNHLLHHLHEEQILKILKQCEQMTKKKVIFNDIERSDFGYLLFNVFSRPLFNHSFITNDGLISIKRSFTESELAELAPPGWKVQQLFPFRLLLSYDAE